ncbi:hypothetical protein R5R35_003233 [Gryllus longicercus]|uniref:CHK kinase-like domain-containing protein n=1 Tax=Gryllus longicercus TaxID=2509291 RepID=A0AAN9VQR9_9ORTH
MTSDNPEKWIRSVLVPRLLKSDVFQEASVLRTEVKALETMKDNFASEMYEINFLLSREGEDKNISLILKLMSEDEITRKQMQSEKQFFNEIHFYSSVKPLFSSQTSFPHLKSAFDNMFPTCIYSHYNEKEPQSFEDAVLVMKNLKVHGFQLGNRTSLDFDHFALAVQSLGRFHAFSYYLKEQDPDKFRNVIEKPIRETTYTPQNIEICNNGLKISQNRVLNALRTTHSIDNPYVTRLLKILERKTYDLLTDLVTPQEPLAVLCHGDFLRNNVLFRYEDGKPVEMKFIDFQTIRYASPAIDLSLLLCMNSTHELREKHFHELLKVYHTSLRKTLAALLGKPEGELHPCYNFETFLADFRRHAVYGYIITVMFLPVMFADPADLSELVKLSWEEQVAPENIELSLRLGGENATRALVSLTEDLIEMQYL